MSSNRISGFIGLVLVLAGSVSSAQNSTEMELFPGRCSERSKNPRCWEGRDNTKWPRPWLCLPRNSCGVIDSVFQDKNGIYHCMDLGGFQFSCDTLARRLGEELEGLRVKITVPYFDGCHISGGCGGHACIPSYAEASLDALCD